MERSQSRQPWLVWVAVGMSALALLVALAGRVGPSPMEMAGGGPPQAFGQLGGPPRSADVAPPGAQQDMPQGPQAQQQGPPQAQQQGAPQTQQQGPQLPQGGRQRGPAGRMDQQPAGPMGQQPGMGAPGRQGPSGRSGPSGLLGIAAQLYEGASQLAVPLLLIAVGFFALRGRRPAAASQAPAQAPAVSPTGEVYVEEPSAEKPADTTREG